MNIRWMGLLLLLSGAAWGAASHAAEGVVDDISLSDLLNLEVSVATKTAMTVEEAPSIVSVITGDQIRHMGARHLPDVLRTVPGFDMTHQVSIPNHMNRIRGVGSTASIKMMINGTTINYYNTIYDMIPVNNISRIEIIRGPGSAIYGTGAFFGTINIITKEGGDDPSQVSLEAGSYDSFKTWCELSHADEELKVYLYADFYRTDGYDGIVESDATDLSEYYEGVTPGELNADGRYNSFQANIRYGDFFFNGYYLEDKWNSPAGIAMALTDENEITDKAYHLVFGYENDFSDRSHLLFKIYYDRFELDRFWEVFPEETAEMDLHTGFPPGEGINGNPQCKYTTLGSEIQGSYDVYPGIEMMGGISYDFIETFDVRSYANHNVTGAPLEVDGVIYPDFPYQYFHTGWTDISENGNWMEASERNVFAVYAQSVFDIKKLLSLNRGVEALSFTVGVRHDDYDDAGSTTNPRFGVVYAPTEKWYVKTLYGTAFRAPNSSEQYIKNNPAQDGNPDLKPVELETAEIQVGYNFTRNIRSSLTGYLTRTDNMIILKNRDYVNEGESESIGLEWEMKIGFDKYRYAYANCTWMDVANTTHDTIRSPGGQSYIQEDYNPGGIPAFMANLGVNYDFFDEHLIANLSLNYVGERDRTEEKKWVGETLSDMDQRGPTKDRLLVNASLTFRNFREGLEFQISGFNLLGTDHRDPDNLLYYDMPEPGRWFTGRVSYAF